MPENEETMTNAAPALPKYRERLRGRYPDVAPQNDQEWDDLAERGFAEDEEKIKNFEDNNKVIEDLIDSDKDLAAVYQSQYYDMPLSYQGMLLGLMVAQGVLVTDNVPIMTLHFYAPIYLLLTVCDREPKREKEALKTLEEHLRQFDKLYGRTIA